MKGVKIKFVSILLILTMLSTFIMVPVVYASEKWSGQVASSFAGGSGTIDDPYLISNGDELMYISAMIDAVWEKENSIVVSSLKHENGIFTASVNAIDVKEDSDVYFGVYDESGALRTVVSKPVSAGNSSFDISTQERYDEIDCILKFMTWNENMEPDGRPYKLQRTNANVVLESAHDYPMSADKTSIYEYNGVCKSIDVTFSQDTKVESGYDFIYIYDSNDNEIGKYTGTVLAGKTINVPGNTVKIRLTSDGVMSYYGYRTESIVVNS